MAIAGTRTSANALTTCLGCGCLCDDLTVQIRDGRVVEIAPECELGLRWFTRNRDNAPVPDAMIEGRPAALSEALDRAVERLRGARSPLIYGLTQTSTEAVRDALALADHLGARVWLDRTAGDLGRVAAFSQAGRVSATLGEVKNRADLVVFFGDPVSTHPRHWERYSVNASGRFVSGRENRTVIVIDDQPNPSSNVANSFCRCPVESEYEGLTSLVALIRGKSFELDECLKHTGIDPDSLLGLARQLRRATYGAIFYASRQRSVIDASACWELLAQLVRELNQEGRRFVLLGLGANGNIAGAEAALTWQGGFAQNLDYRLGYPMALDSSLDLDEVIDAGEIDLICAVGGDPPTLRAHSLPVIAIAPNISAWVEPIPTVAITTAMLGSESGGTVMRSDGVVLPLRPPLRSPYPSESDCMRELSRRISP